MHTWATSRFTQLIIVACDERSDVGYSKWTSTWTKKILDDKALIWSRVWFYNSVWSALSRSWALTGRPDAHSSPLGFPHLDFIRAVTVIMILDRF